MSARRPIPAAAPTPDPAEAARLRRLELALDGAISVEEAMAFVGLGMTEVYELMGTGVIRYAQHGRRRLVSKRSCVEFLADRLVEPAAEGGIDGRHGDHDPDALHGPAGVPPPPDQPRGLPRGRTGVFSRVDSGARAWALLPADEVEHAAQFAGDRERMIRAVLKYRREVKRQAV